MRRNKYKAQAEKVHGTTNYDKMNGHVERMQKRVEDFGFRAWGDDGKTAVDRAVSK